METKGLFLVLVILLMFIGIVGTLETENEYTEHINKYSEPVNKYLFGVKGDLDFDSNFSRTSIMVAALMIWLVIFTMTGDIIENFSTLGPATSWTVALLLAITIANTGIELKTMITFAGKLSSFGTFAIIFPLILSILAFIGLQIGFGPILRTWLKRKKELRLAAEGYEGGTEAGIGIKAAKLLGDEALKRSQLGP